MVFHILAWVTCWPCHKTLGMYRISLLKIICLQYLFNGDALTSNDILYEIISGSDLFISDSPIICKVVKLYWLIGQQLSEYAVLSLVLCVCFVDRCWSLCTFSFGHCVVCSSLIYRLWLSPFWYLQTLLTINEETSVTGIAITKTIQIVSF